MKPLLRNLPLLAALLLVAGLTSYAQSGSTGTTTVSVTIGPEAALTVSNSNTPLTSSGTNFSDFAGTTSLTYFVRTSATGGSGSITLKVTSDFSPVGGPSVASPPTSGDALTYTCTVSSPGTACSGTQTASASSQTNLATFGTDVHTSPAGTSASVGWTLSNDPRYKTGTYNATVTFTISAS